MPDSNEPAVRITGVILDYRGLRPLRLKALDVADGQSVALMGLDRSAASVFVDLVTGASLPDAGEVAVFGRSTRDITDGATWLGSLERFGLLGERTVLVDQLTAEQNLAIPVTLAVHDLATDLRTRLRVIADEVGLEAPELDQPVVGLSPLSRFRVQLGRALVLEPRMLLAEHPTAALAPAESAQAAQTLARVVERRRLTSLLLTLDRALADAVASRVLTLQLSTGEVVPMSGWRRWFS
jgi:ABC-type lipoprotein export system ATPase subunit